MAKEKTTTATPSFEQAMTELEQLVGRMERGDLPLEDALKAFEQGTALVRVCQDKLAAVELRVEKVLAAGGTVKTTPFATDNEE